MYLPKTFLAVILLANIYIVFESKIFVDEKIAQKKHSRNFQSAREVMIILALSLMLARVRTLMQDSIVGGLVSGGKVKYIKNDLMLDTLQTHSLITVVSGIFTNSNHQIRLTNYILTVFALFLFIYSIYLLLNSYIEKSIVRIIFSCLICFYNPIYQSFATFYPALSPGNNSTWGIIGIGLSVFVISSAYQRKYIQSGLFFGILLISHLAYFIITALVILILLISIFISDQKLIKSNIKGFSKFILSFGCLLPITLPYVIRYYISAAFRYSTNNEKVLYGEYLQNLDLHRNPNVHFSKVFYIASSIGLILLLSLYLQSKVNIKSKLQKVLGDQYLLFCFLLLLGSISTYTVQIILFRKSDSSIFSTLMLGRVPLVAGIVLAPLYLLFLGIFMKSFVASKNLQKYKKTSRHIQVFIIVMMLILMGRAEIINQMHFPKSPFIQDKERMLDSKVPCSFLDDSRRILTSPSAGRLLLLNCRSPIVFDYVIDTIPYQKENISIVDSHMKDLFGFGISNPPSNTKHTGGISDASVQRTWENRDLTEWSKLACKYDFSTIVVPNSWGDLELAKMNRSSIANSYKIYKFVPNC
jgi:hypothetical protein